MGMFDHIHCEYPLPSNEKLDKLGLKLQDIDYQTKDLHNCLEVYTITKDGKLFYKQVEREWVDDDNAFLKGYLQEISSKDVQVMHHGEILFYHYEILKESETKGQSVSIDYKAKFTDGIVSSIELVDCEIADASEYLTQQKAFWDKEKARRKKWYNKYIFYTKIYRAFSRYCIYKPVYMLYKLTGKLHTFVIRYF
jgi:hypothetical protein